MRSARLIGIVVVMVAASGMAMFNAAASADPFTYTTIYFPGSTYTEATGINDGGVVVGDYYIGNLEYGFEYANGVYTSISEPLASIGHTSRLRINNAGVIAGTYGNADWPFSNPAYGFIDSSGVFTTINPSGPPILTIGGINNSGVVVGNYDDVPLGQSRAFTYANGTFTSISNPFLGNVSCIMAAYGINDAGTTVGTYCPGSTYVGFVDTGGVFTTIDVPGSTNTEIDGINDSGAIIGGYTKGGKFRSFFEVGGLLTDITFPSADFTILFGINNLGDLVGEYSKGQNQYGFVATPSACVLSGNCPVPPVGIVEPPTLSLFGAALLNFAGFAMYRRRKQTSADLAA